MALPTWASQSVTRLRPSVKLSRGSTVPDWSNPSELVISGCSIQPASTGLSQDGRVLGISEGYTVYLPPGSDVKAGDRISFGGNVYTINGEPKTWEGATGRVSHVQINVERWAG
jgi:hypothetical protein